MQAFETLDKVLKRCNIFDLLGVCLQEVAIDLPVVQQQLEALRHPGSQINMSAWVLCMSWCADLEFWVTHRTTGQKSEGPVDPSRLAGKGHALAFLVGALIGVLGEDGPFFAVVRALELPVAGGTCGVEKQLVRRRHEAHLQGVDGETD